MKTFNFLLVLLVTTILFNSCTNDDDIMQENSSININSSTRSTVKPTLSIKLEFSSSVVPELDDRGGIHDLNLTCQGYCSATTSDNYDPSLVIASVSLDMKKIMYNDAAYTEGTVNFLFLDPVPCYSEAIPAAITQQSYIDGNSLRITPTSLYDTYNIVWNSSIPIIY